MKQDGNTTMRGATMRGALRTVVFGGLGLAALGALCQPAAAQAITVWIGSGTPGPMMVVPQQVPVADDPALQMMRRMDAEMGAMMNSLVAPMAIDADLARMMAQQAAMMRQMAAGMAPGPLAPGTMAPGMMAGGMMAGGMGMAGMGTAGAGICSQVTTITFDADGQPHATVRRTGTACGALPSERGAPPPVSIQLPPEAAPEPEATEPAPSSRLIQVDHRRNAPQKPIYRG